MNSIKENNSTDRFIKTLDGWRTIAVFLVIYSHYAHVHFKDAANPIIHFLGKNAAKGGFGVDIFFAISGFLITTRMIYDFRKKGKIDLKSFYIRRFFRILPASTFYLLTLFILTMLGAITVLPIEFLSCLTFWRNYLVVSGLPNDISFTNHFWSLSIEEHFYMILPITLTFFGVNRKTLIKIGIGILAVVVWRSIDSRYNIFAPLGVAFQYNYQHSLVRFDGLLWGVFWAFVVEFFSEWKILSLVKKQFFQYLVVLFTFSLFFLIYLPAQRVWVALFCSLMLISTVLNAETYLAKFLELSWMKFFGRLSYSLYLWQHLFCNGIQPNTPQWFAYLQGPISSLISLLIVSFLSYSFIEKPLIKVGHKISHSTN